MFNLSPKQKLSIKESINRINLWEGAVRSGKSFASLIRWLEYVQHAPPGNLVIIGRTATTIKHNIIDEIARLIGMDSRHYIGKNELHIWGRRIYLIGASDERAETKIRGSTFAGGYIDEATLIPESFWVMLLSRLSIEGSKLFATTNADSPFHWLKKNYLDRQNELKLSTWHFFIDDNPSLTEDFKDNLKREYQGLWYKRYIDAEWCLAEGAVFDFFDDSLHIIDFPLNPAEYYIVGIDYGTTNPCSFSLIGYNSGAYPNLWLEKEYYYESQKHCRQKSDYDYALDLIDFIKGYNIEGIYIDPSASSLKQELRRNSIFNVIDAKNDVLPGIRYMSQLLSNGTYKICSNCVNAIKEYHTYLWDSKAIEKGEDKPLKKYDHSIDSQRYALFTHFFKRDLSYNFTEEDAKYLERLYRK